MRNFLIAGLALAAVACTPAEEESATDGEVSAAENSGKPHEGPAPEVFAGTAWRSTADDGARFTTYFDEGGTYRDMRNGDEWQTGTWRYVEAGPLLCFIPDGDDVAETCWKPGKMRGDTMEATDADDRRIELEKVDYVPPVEEGEE